MHDGKRQGRIAHHVVRAHADGEAAADQSAQYEAGDRRQRHEREREPAAADADHETVAYLVVTTTLFAST